eukprot:gb/GEZN01008447.1/.p1 GENE.gb/GEZN01008447.1/~~gb/GEZN01008447.1/.p1  ORF type:complete len:306 (-),score=39.92 gb/GEZN01008447.1/:444-1361(-)
MPDSLAVAGGNNTNYNSIEDERPGFVKNNKYSFAAVVLALLTTAAVAGFIFMQVPFSPEATAEPTEGGSNNKDGEAGKRATTDSPLIEEPRTTRIPRTSTTPPFGGERGEVRTNPNPAPVQPTLPNFSDRNFTTSAPLRDVITRRPGIGKEAADRSFEDARKTGRNPKDSRDGTRAKESNVGKGGIIDRTVGIRSDFSAEDLTDKLESVDISADDVVQSVMEKLSGSGLTGTSLWPIKGGGSSVWPMTGDGRATDLNLSENIDVDVSDWADRERERDLSDLTGTVTALPSVVPASLADRLRTWGG